MKLGVNIDHVATVRQARGETFPDPVNAAREAVNGGADGITAHLREDRRHIQDRDIIRLKQTLTVPLNMEMAVTPSLVRIAKKVKPAWACLVPERRQELTTEGGLEVKANARALGKTIESLHDAGIRVSMFIEPSLSTIQLCRDLEADAIEIHTGRYARLFKKSRSQTKAELRRIAQAAEEAHRFDLLVNAGHGIDYENVGPLSKIFPFHEYNIGFAIVAHAVFVGLRQAVKDMKEKMREACVES